MSDDSDVNVKFGASYNDVIEAVGKIQGVFKDLVDSFAGVATAIAGGAAFKDFVDTAQTITQETARLAQAMGIAGDEAAALRTAIGDVGGSAETYRSAFDKFSRQLAVNGDDLRQYGVDVDGVRNGTVTGAQAFQQALQSVSTYKAGIDQSIVAHKLFGRSVQDVQTLLKVTPELNEEARKTNEALNLTITGQSVAASQAYTKAMSGVGDVIEGVKKTIGEGLIPILTESADRFSSFGPALVAGTKAAVETFVEIFGEMRSAVGGVLSDIGGALATVATTLRQAFGGSESLSAMQVFSNALAVVHAAFIGFRVSFEEVANAITTGLQILGTYFGQFAATVDRLLHFDFQGTKAIWQAAIDERNKILQDGIDKAVQIATKGQQDLEKVLGLADSQPHAFRASDNYGDAYTPKGGDKHAPVDNKDASAIAAARLQVKKAAAEAELALTKELLSEEQSAVSDAYKQGLLSLKDYYDDQLQVTLAGIDAQIAAKKKERDEAQAAQGARGVKPDQALKFKAQEIALSGQINVLEAQRNQAVIANAAAYRDAERERLDALAAFAAAQAKAGTDDDVTKKRAALQQEVALRQVTAQQEFEVERQLEDESYAALQANIAARAALIRGSEDEQAKQRQALQLEAEQNERDHQSKLTDIANRAELDRKQYSIQAQQAVQSSFQDMLSSWLQGTARMSDALRQFAVNVGNQFATLVAKKFTDKLFDVSGINKAVDSMVDVVTSGIEKVVAMFVTGEAEKTAASEAGLAERWALELASSVKSIALWAATALKNIANFAYQAAAGAFNAMVSIPYVGPVLAVGAAAAAIATVLGFAKSIVSSAGGDEQVAADGLRLVHKDETILPVSYADPLRKLLGSFGGSGQAPVPTALPAFVSRVGQINSAATPSFYERKQMERQRKQGGGTVNFTVQALDSKSVVDMIHKHGRAIANSLATQNRNFTVPKPR